MAGESLCLFFSLSLSLSRCVSLSLTDLCFSLLCRYTMEVLNRKYGPEFFWGLCFLVIVVNLYFFVSAGLLSWKERSGILRWRTSDLLLLISRAAVMDHAGPLSPQLLTRLIIWKVSSLRRGAASLSSNLLLLMADLSKKNSGDKMKRGHEERVMLVDTFR
jgi:hypothetical protein